MERKRSIYRLEGSRDQVGGKDVSVGAEKKRKRIQPDVQQMLHGNPVKEDM